MKRIFTIVAVIAALAMTACGPVEDERMVAMNEFMSTQNAPGVYSDSKVDFAFDQAKHQAYFNKESRTYRIMDEGGDKYVQFVLDADPVVGQTLNVASKSYGFGLASNTTYKNLKVDKIENNLCHLRSSAEGGYVGIIIAWVE